MGGFNDGWGVMMMDGWMKVYRKGSFVIIHRYVPLEFYIKWNIDFKANLKNFYD